MRDRLRRLRRDTKRAAPESNDLAEERLTQLLRMTPYPDTLSDLVDLSRNTFGWFTKQEARSLEYPWVVEHCGKVEGKSFVDIGAGISPVPLALADRGATVTTVDYMESDVRALSSRDEWGWLDYSQLRPGITSLNTDASRLDLEESSRDGVLSISVIEHMPADVRRAVLQRAGAWVKPGGVIVLTVDLRPGTNLLWNLDRGQVVEPDDLHGTLRDLETEVTHAGFDIMRTEVVRWAPDRVRTDIALLLGMRRDIRSNV